MSSILFIAPFEALAEQAAAIIRRLGLDIDVQTASNEQAVDIAKSHPDKTVLISRGGTAYDLKKVPERTVVEVSTTFSDILTELEAAVFAGYKTIGIVTNDNIIDNSVRNFTFHDTRIWLRPCKTHTEIRNTVQKVCHEGAQFIIGCHQAVERAKELHVDNKYIHSGTLAIERAIYEALRIEMTRGLARFQMERLNAVIDNIREGIVIFDRNHVPVFFNTIAQAILERENKNDWYRIMSGQAVEQGRERITVLGNTKVILKRISLEMKDRGNDVFVFQRVSEIEKQERAIRLSSHRRGFYAKAVFSGIFTQSPAMKQILIRAEKFARTDSNVLIYGATGTGKEGVAQSIHNASARVNHPFVSVNCASLPKDLIESELFGYVDGAFTGARKSGKPGLFEMAHKGTIFLDEIGELPLDMQGRLLRVLQEREVMRIGDDRIIPLDIRVICATNRDLRALAKEEKFRYDLYYRVNVLRITLPTLKEREEDIWPLLVRYFKQYSHGRKLQVEQGVQKKLLTYSWPGNIRELKNIAEVLAFEDGVITKNMIDTLLEQDDELQIPYNQKYQEISVPADISLKEMEQAFLTQLLQRKSQAEVCSQLGISRVTLWRKLHDVSKTK